jgi:hypothetical protein
VPEMRRGIHVVDGRGDVEGHRGRQRLVKPRLLAAP